MALPIPYLKLARDKTQLKTGVALYSEEAERAVLGSLFLDTTIADAIFELVGSNDFFVENHADVFEAMVFFQQTGRPITVNGVADFLEKKQLLQKIGGMGYLQTLEFDTLSAANAEEYAKIIRANSILRSFTQIGRKVQELAYQSDEYTIPELVDKAEQAVMSLRNSDTNTDYFRLGDLMLKVGEKVDLLKTNPEAATGIPTGFIELDRMTNGLSKGDLVIVAGRPSMGKTTFAMNVAEHVAIDQKKAVAVFSLEMSAEQIAFRVASSYGRIDQQRMRTGQLDDSDWDKLVSVINLVDEAPMYLVEVGGLSPMELRSRARKINARHGPLGLIVIDYIQLMQTESSENRVNAVSEISRSLKALARELNVPVIALSQLNRGVDARDNKRPRMSDLRESGAIEQDADIILFIYRDEVYNKDTEDKGIAEIIIGKQRNGPTGMVKAAFMGQYTRFDNLASQSYDY